MAWNRFILSSSVSDDLVDRFRQRLAALNMEIHSTHRVALRRCLPLTRRQGSTIRSTGRWRAARGHPRRKRPSADSSLVRAHYLDECREGDTCVRRRTLWTGGGRDDSGPTKRPRSQSPTTPNTASAARSTRAISSAGGASRIKLTPESRAKNHPSLSRQSK
jgi:hypothetical protein